MKRIDKKLSELPEIRLNQVKPKVENLLEVLKCRDRGEDLTEFLEPFGNRLDKYFAEVVKDCKTAIVVFYKEGDQYYMINKSKKCVNLTFLCSRFRRIPLSEWLTNNSVFYFNTVLPDLPLSTAVPSFEGDAHRLVFEIALEAMGIVDYDGFERDDLKEIFEIRSKSGEFESIDNFKLGNTELNEMHFIAISIHYFLMNNPLDIEVEWKNKGEFELYLIPGFVDTIPILKMYNKYQGQFGLHPMSQIDDELRSYNQFIVSNLETEGIFY